MQIYAPFDTKIMKRQNRLLKKKKSLKFSQNPLKIARKNNYLLSQFLALQPTMRI